MLESLFPAEYLNSIFDIDYDRLMAMGKTALLFDVDNTLEPFDVPHPSEKVHHHLIHLKEQGFAICLISNNQKHRVEQFNRNLLFPCVYKAGKPRKKGVRQALGLLGVSATQTVLIGDQVFTDILCGNRCGLYSILVQPVALRDEWTVKLKRGLEKKVIQYYLRRQQHDQS